MVSRLDSTSSVVPTRPLAPPTTPSDAAPAPGPLAADQGAVGWAAGTPKAGSVNKTLALGTVGTVTVDGQGSYSQADGVSATATAAFKALLGSTTIDTTGTGLTIKNNALTQAQFQAAVKTLFGDKATLSNAGTFKYVPNAGVSASLVTAFKSASQAFSLDSAGALQVKQGKASGTLDATVKALLGSSVLIAGNSLVFKDNAFVSASLNDELQTKFGAGGSLDGTLALTADRAGLKSAEATAALKVLLGHTSIDTTGTGLKITNKDLTDAHFQAALKTVFGDRASLDTTGAFRWSRDSGISADLVSAFKVTSGALAVDGKGALTVKDGHRSAQFEASLRDVLGSNVVVANNTLTFKDERFDSAKVEAEITHKFGTTGSLAGTFAATANQGGLQSAQLTAAYKALLGNTTIDTSGTGLTIKNNALTQAQFQAAVTTLFGPKASLSNDGTFSWNKDSGVSASLVTAFKQVTPNLTLAADGTLALKAGKIDGTLAEQLKAVLGKNTLVANNQVVFADNRFQSATLDDQLTTQFGKSASLETTFKASLEAGAVKSAQLTAAYKALLGNSTIDTTGSGLTIKNSGLTDAQFKAAVQTVFGDGATLSNTGTFAWSKGSGVSADLVSSFKATRGALTLGADGSLVVKQGKVSGLLSEQLSQVLGPNAVVANNQVVFKDNAFSAAQLDDQLVHTFGSGASLATTVQASLDRQGVQSATVTAAYKALLGKSTIDTTGTGLKIANNGLTQAQFKAAVQTVFGPTAQLDSHGAFTWDKKSGVSADLVSSFKTATNNLSLGADGSLQVRGGKVSGQLEASVRAVLGTNTMVANNQVVFADNRFQSANLDEQLTQQFGKDASLATTFQASLDQSGVKTATATAAFKALLGGTSLDTTGTGFTLTNNGLTKAQFQAAVQTMFGPSAHVTSQGTFSWTKDSGISAELASGFTGAWKALSVDSKGSLQVKEGKASGTLDAQLKAVLGANTVVSNNQLVFRDNRFDSAALEDSVTTAFGPKASLQSTVQASLDRSGLQTVTATAAYKALLGGTTIDTTGTGFTIKNRTLTDAQFRAALQTVLGPSAQLTNNATFEYSKDSGVTASLATAFEKTTENLQLAADGTLGLKAGKVSGSLESHVKALLGNNAVVANGAIVFDRGHFDSATLEDSLTRTFGKDANLTATFKATATQDGLADATIKVGAFKRLKQLGEQGAIDLSPDGTVAIKNGKVDRAEVGALLSVVSGKIVNLSTDGRLVYQGGKLDPKLTETLAAAWGNTTLDSSGTLTMKDGHPELDGKLSALFGGATVKGGASIEVAGTSSAKLNLNLASQLGKNASLDGTGALVIDKGHLTGAQLTTSLVTTGKTPAAVGLTGLISVTDHAAQGKLDAQLKAGALEGALGVGGATSVQLYTPQGDDSARLGVQAKGGVWAERDARFDVKGNLGGTVPVRVGAASVQLGVKNEATSHREVHTLSVHPTTDDALGKSPVTVLHAPTTVDQVLAMRPYEQFTDQGERTIGLGGSVSVGYGVGPANVSAGGSVYYSVSSNLERDIERLDGGKVRVRFLKGEGKTEVATVSAGVGLSAGKVLPDNALVQKAAPIVEQVAKAGVSASLEKLNENDSVFDVTIDTSTPQGKAALQHVLNDELSEAQYWAGFAGSGVTLNSQLQTSLSAQTKKLDLQVGTLDKQSMSRWLQKQQTSVTASDFTFTGAVDKTRKDKAFFPWNSDRHYDIRLVHESKVEVDGQLPDVGQGTEQGAMEARLPGVNNHRAPTLADSQALIGVRLKVSDPSTSLQDLKNELDPTLEAMRQVGFTPEEASKVAALRGALDAGLAPDKKAYMKIPLVGGVGDKRFGQTSVDVEGFIGPKAFPQLFAPGGVVRTQADFQKAYLESSGGPLSTAGTRAAIAKALGAQLVPGAGDTIDVVKGGHTLGTLTSNDVEALRQGFVAAAREPLKGGPDENSNEMAPAWVPFNVGHWNVGNLPVSLVFPYPDRYDAHALVARADAFGETLEQAATLYAQNQPPAKHEGEADAAYETRLGQWKQASLYNQPDLFFSKLDGLFQKQVMADKTSTNGLTLLRLAGADGVYGRAEVEVPPETLQAMVNTGRSNVQRFAAVSVLVSQGASIDGAGNLVFAKPPTDAAAALTAAKTLLGPGATLATQGLSTAVSGGAWPSNDFKAALGQFLAGARAQSSGLLAPPAGLSTEATSKLVGTLFGKTAMVTSAGLAFDNRGYGIVHLEDALAPFGETFGPHAQGVPPPLFPLIKPVPNEGPSQQALTSQLLARHQGSNAHWGDAFGNLGYLRGETEDLTQGAGSKAGPNAWILK